MGSRGRRVDTPDHKVFVLPCEGTSPWAERRTNTMDGWQLASFPRAAFD